MSGKSRNPPKLPRLNSVPLRSNENLFRDSEELFNPLHCPQGHGPGARGARMLSRHRAAREVAVARRGGGAASTSPETNASRRARGGIAPRLPKNLTKEQVEAWKKMNDVGTVPHSVLLGGEKPYLAGHPEFSALMSGFLGGTPQWRTLHRTPLHTDYCGDTCNYTDDVGMQTHDRARKITNRERAAAVQRGEATSASLIEDDRVEPPKATVSYDYCGRRVVIDSAHQPVPPPVHPIKQNYFRPSPWDCGSPALTTYAKGRLR